MASAPLDLLQGTLDVLILKTLAWGPRHGYAVARWIRDTTSEELLVEDGALYTALHRLERKGWLASEWGATDDNRRVKLYTMTATGKKELQQRIKQWDRYAAAVSRILHAA